MSTSPPSPIIEEYVIEIKDKDDPSNDDIDLLGLNVGILEEAFTVLKNTSGSDRKHSKSTLCGLLVGEIKLTQKYEKYKGKLFGYTEGIGKSALNESKKAASKSVIFMVISLTENWKIPVGLFFVHNPDIKYFADAIEETLRKLNSIGIETIFLTLNCVSPHLSFALAEELGAEIDSSKPSNSFKTYFHHPSNASLIHIFYDLDIIVGFLKSYLARERMIHYKNRIINYSMCLDVKKIEENDLSCYRAEALYEWIIIKKRLSYDPETLGRTTADAMEYLKDLGHPDFQESGPTIQFLKVMDLISQISRVNGQEGEHYMSLSETNEQDWKPIILNILAYMKELRSVNQDTPDHLSVFKTLVTGITVYFTSLLEIYSTHVKERNETDIFALSCILPSRFALRHIRLGFLEGSLDKVDVTALGLFKKMKAFISRLHLIEKPFD